MRGIGMLTSAMAAVGLCIAEMCREQRCFQVTKYMFQTEKVSSVSGKIKIVFLSDQHNKVYGNKNKILYESVKAQMETMSSE